MVDKKIPFSPPDISQLEIDEVVDTLKSGWITTGPKTKELEKQLAEYCGTERTVCLNSATAGLELVLRLLDIGPGDEVITTPYTFAATSNVILHTGAKPVFVDIKKGEFNIDPQQIERAITKKTKAVIPVDFGGWPCDYDEIYQVLESKKKYYHPKKHTYQESFDRPVILIDAAHSLGSAYKGKKSGSMEDFSVFSFHAVKNFTTAEGGAVTFNSKGDLTAGKIYQQLMLLSLHGQNKDALEKYKSGGWKYNIEIPGYKYNMTDITASLGLAQMKRFESELQVNRKIVYEVYDQFFINHADKFIIPPFHHPDKVNNYHLYPLRMINEDEEKRDLIIQKMAEKNIALNVHFIPVVMHSAYRKLGYKIEDFKNAWSAYKREISLPVYSKLAEEDALYVCGELLKVFDTISRPLIKN